jgi:hypothetical protein
VLSAEFVDPTASSNCYRPSPDLLRNGDEVATVEKGSKSGFLSNLLRVSRLFTFAQTILKRDLVHLAREFVVGCCGYMPRLIHITPPILFGYRAVTLPDDLWRVEFVALQVSASPTFRHGQFDRSSDSTTKCGFTHNTRVHRRVQPWDRPGFQ